MSIGGMKMHREFIRTSLSILDNDLYHTHRSDLIMYWMV